jgi:hypothetical protein
MFRRARGYRGGEMANLVYVRPSFSARREQTLRTACDAGSGQAAGIKDQRTFVLFR